MTSSISPKATPGPILGFRVRVLAHDDAARLSRFYQALPEQSRYFFEPYADVSVDAMNEVVRRALSGFDFSSVALDEAGGIIGHFFFMDVASEVPHLGIGLREDAQGTGLGGVFLAYLIAVGRRVLRKNAIGLTVMKTNARALRLYQRHGFQIVREDVSFRSANDSYEMRLTFD
ncbi:MAG: GNAT family N-acetyltransferase [Candidatus Hydrogenedentes bacterium]|nr:GNAT family N-acetyltransferase [Candidatus Hydrogenedentota bacterium]